MKLYPAKCSNCGEIDQGMSIAANTQFYCWNCNKWGYNKQEGLPDKPNKGTEYKPKGKDTLEKRTATLF